MTRGSGTYLVDLGGSLEEFGSFAWAERPVLGPHAIYPDHLSFSKYDADCFGQDLFERNFGPTGHDLLPNVASDAFISGQHAPVRAVLRLQPVEVVDLVVLIRYRGERGSR